LDPLDAKGYVVLTHRLKSFVMARARKLKGSSKGSLVL
jgi:hypothetical protein